MAPSSSSSSSSPPVPLHQQPLTQPASSNSLAPASSTPRSTHLLPQGPSIAAQAQAPSRLAFSAALFSGEVSRVLRHAVRSHPTSLHGLYEHDHSQSHSRNSNSDGHHGIYHHTNDDTRIVTSSTAIGAGPSSSSSGPSSTAGTAMMSGAGGAGFPSSSTRSTSYTAVPTLKMTSDSSTADAAVASALTSTLSSKTRPRGAGRPSDADLILEDRQAVTALNERTVAGSGVSESKWIAMVRHLSTESGRQKLAQLRATSSLDGQSVPAAAARTTLARIPSASPVVVDADYDDDKSGPSLTDQSDPSTLTAHALLLSSTMELDGDKHERGIGHTRVSCSPTSMQLSRAHFEPPASAEGGLTVSAASAEAVSSAPASSSTVAMVPLDVAKPSLATDSVALIIAPDTPTHQRGEALDIALARLSPTDALSEFGCDASRGLSRARVPDLLLQHGPNELNPTKPTPLWLAILYQLTNALIVVLMLSSIVSMVLGEYVEGVAILVTIMLNITLAVYTEHSADQALSALMAMSKPLCTVLRDGERLEVPCRDVVPGDIVMLTVGDIVPADCRVISSAGLKTNELLLTGESADVSKRAEAATSEQLETLLTPPNMVFSSTHVVAGHAVAIVIATGMNTRLGSIAKLLSRRSDDLGDQPDTPSGKSPKSNISLPSFGPAKTPMQLQLHRMGLLMGFIAIVLCSLIFAVGLARGYNDPDRGDQPTWLQMLLISVTLGVSAVPEGLPLVTTVCLALGSQRLAHSNALVRRLPAVESLGSVNVICTDKTGTLTAGKMTAVKMVTADTEYNVSGKGFDPNGEVFRAEDSASVGGADISVHVTALTSLLCNNTSIVRDSQTHEWMPVGNGSEAPLVVLAAKLKLDATEQRARYPRVDEVPFSSERKMMVTVHLLAAADKPSSAAPVERAFHTLRVPSEATHVVCTKGAPNMLLAACTHQLGADGTPELLDAAARRTIMEHVDRLSGQALRVLGVAYAPVDLGAVVAASSSSSSSSSPSTDVSLLGDESARFAVYTRQPLVWSGMIGSIDPERDGVADSIRIAKRAGIRTVMITGDYLATAVAIARNIGLLAVGADTAVQAVDSERLRPNGVYLGAHEIDEITARTLVYARARPEDKLQVVLSLQRQGFICAMTGDGVNDAPSLKQADVGVAMGSGTSVAKQASQIVLLDDNFNTIVRAIEYGRTIYANIQKFVLFLFGTNSAQIAVVFLSVIFGLPVPLMPLQILYINLVTDGCSAIALSASEGEAGVMNDAPRDRTQSIIRGPRLAMIAGHSGALVLSMLLVFVIGLYWYAGSLTLSALYPSGVPMDQITCKVMVVDGNASSERVTVVGNDCAKLAVEKARTMVFIVLCFSESLRAFTVRWYHRSVFSDLLSNPTLLLTTAVSTTATLLILFVPALQEVFYLTDLEWYGWLLCAAVIVATATLDEYIKLRVHRKEKKQRARELLFEKLGEVLGEVRAVRQHVRDVELQVVELAKEIE